MNFEAKDFKNKSIKRYLEEKGRAADEDFSQLQEFLYSLVTLFEFSDTGITLCQLLQRDWALFTSEDACRTVINELIQTDDATFGKYGIVDGNSTVVYKGSITACVTVWETLKEDIKNHHRFTTDLDRLKAAGWETLLDNQWPLNPADSFYRARIHYKKTDSFGVDDMGAPERGDCPAGRANPEGIPYLYLTEEPKTTFYETRVNMHDVVSVGEFKIVGDDPLLVENLTDIDLNEIDDLLDEDVVTLAKRKLLIQALSKDMSNPMRRFDSKIEYVPTQFICEYVQKTQKVSGIRFSSSVYSRGTNLVIFDPSMMHCINVVDYNIKSLDIKESLF